MSKLHDMLIRHEGERLDMYRDSKGLWTIGVGRNIQERGITQSESRFMLETDIDICREELRRAFVWYPVMDEVRQSAMIDLALNMGVPTLKTFTKMMGFMELGEYDLAAAELLRGSGEGGKSRYYVDVGARAEEISAMIRTGEWQ